MRPLAGTFVYGDVYGIYAPDIEEGFTILTIVTVLETSQLLLH